MDRRMRFETAVRALSAAGDRLLVLQYKYSVADLKGSTASESELAMGGKVSFESR